jgi:exosortase H (IPTLxxWG-CTERM-specific)
MFRFLIVFLSILGFGVLLITQPEVKHVFSEPWGDLLASISYAMMSLWDGNVVRDGSVLTDPTSGFSVAVNAECNGIDAVLVLWAAVLAFPAGLRVKLPGILLGFFAIQTLNLVRIVSLFYLGQWDRDIFTWVHHNLWQGLMILAILLVFLLWLRFLHQRTGEVNGDHRAV